MWRACHELCCSNSCAVLRPPQSPKEEHEEPEEEWRLWLKNKRKVIESGKLHVVAVRPPAFIPRSSLGGLWVRKKNSFTTGWRPQIRSSLICNAPDKHDIRVLRDRKSFPQLSFSFSAITLSPSLYLLWILPYLYQLYQSASLWGLWKVFVLLNRTER